jgi:hypothetical protein
MVCLAITASASIAAGAEPSIQLGQSIVTLNGPWKFHVGDNLHWADPAFDDSSWENVDLTPPEGARDNDVGLTGFVPGWAARGHAGYIGYAWYRIRLNIRPPSGQTLALDGPFVVDSAYQVYVNGQLLGGLGDFNHTIPSAYGFHQPHIFTLPPDLVSGGDLIVAVRVWMGPWAVSDPVGGGMHIAPAIGERAAAADRYRLEWLEVVEGYIVDAVEGVLFLLLMVMALSLAPVGRRTRADDWMAIALFLLAIVRGNQAFLFWWQFETIPEFELFIATLAVPLSLCAWVMVWHYWFGLESPSLTKLVSALTALYIAAQFLSRSWFYGTFPHVVNALLRDVIVCVRLVLLSVFVSVVVRGVRAHGRDRWVAVPAMMALGVGLFAQELSMIRVPGIWFPFGVGVSRTEYAYVIFDVALSVLLLRRLRRATSNAFKTPAPLELNAAGGQESIP